MPVQFGWTQTSSILCSPEPLGGVRNLQVTDPTTSTLNVQWEPAEGVVRKYKIYYIPAAGGLEEMVRCISSGLANYQIQFHLYSPLYKKKIIYITYTQPIPQNGQGNNSPKTPWKSRALTWCLVVCVGGGLWQHHGHRPEEAAVWDSVHSERGPAVCCRRGQSNVGGRQDM